MHIHSRFVIVIPVSNCDNCGFRFRIPVRYEIYPFPSVVQLWASSLVEDKQIVNNPHEECHSCKWFQSCNSATVESTTKAKYSKRNRLRT